ncbi:ABC transporter permease [Pinibacter soli]|uniref:Transport permease protein n=1 Tax=Pinibacter soli TaxID=3044211 RepID=A0ABT6R844_9BACT|nr:ABC transporter permease [Pinibacter soli]MDI3318643.1 ABC transporter permease [Pinibacter soli]
MSTLYKELERESGMAETGNEKEHWDMVIQPKTSMLDLQLKEVWRYRDLIMLFVKRDFVAQVKQTILGPVWHVIQPILTTLMFWVLFGRIAGIDTGVPGPMFYMSGIALWNYFSTCLTSTAGTFVTNAPIFGKVYFPRLILPISVVISNLIKLGIQLGLLLVMMAYYGITGKFVFHFNTSLLLVPIVIFILAGLSLGLGIIISSLTTKYRDFTLLLGFAVQLGMYISPIPYPLSKLAEGSQLRLLLDINPITPLAEAFRYALFGQGTFTVGTLLYSLAFMMVILFFGIIMFNKVEKSFMDTV